MATQEQIESFYRFATERLGNGGAELSMDELYEEWRFENPTTEEFEENVAAIQASIDDMNRGEKGRDAGEIVRELRQKYNLPQSD
jgi:hypothetical protein